MRTLSYWRTLAMLRKPGAWAVLRAFAIILCQAALHCSAGTVIVRRLVEAEGLSSIILNPTTTDVADATGTSVTLAKTRSVCWHFRVCNRVSFLAWHTANMSVMQRPASSCTFWATYLLEARSSTLLRQRPSGHNRCRSS